MVLTELHSGGGVRVRNPPKFGIQVHVYLAVGESDPKSGNWLSVHYTLFLSHPVFVITVASTLL